LYLTILVRFYIRLSQLIRFKLKASWRLGNFPENWKSFNLPDLRSENDCCYTDVLRMPIGLIVPAVSGTVAARRLEDVLTSHF
jgi:hypothetical protein